MKIFYYLIHWTWALPQNIIGLLMFLALKITGHKSYRFRNAICTEVGHGWGGLEMGMFFFIGDDCQSCSPHEYGHTIQMLWWGWLFIFVIGIPSAIRYWYRELRWCRKNLTPPTKYDDIWFEGQATRLGTEAVKKNRKWL